MLLAGDPKAFSLLTNKGELAALLDPLSNKISDLLLNNGEAPNGASDINSLLRETTGELLTDNIPCAISALLKA